MYIKSHQLCLTLCDPMDCSPPGSSVHGILQARILEWVAISSSRGSSWPRDRTHASCSSCIAGRFFTTEAPGKPSESCSVMSDCLQLYSPWNFPGQNTGVGSLSLLQRIFLTQGSNPGPLHCRQILYQLSHLGNPSNSTTGDIPWENHNWKIHMYPSVHCSTIYNSQDIEAT